METFANVLIESFVLKEGKECINKFDDFHSALLFAVDAHLIVAYKNVQTLVHQVLINTSNCVIIVDAQIINHLVRRQRS